MSKFDLIEYLSQASRGNGSTDGPKIQSLKKIGEENKVSIAKLREQLSVARSFGFVDVQPHHGITLKPYQTLIRALEIRSIGIGGDSLVQVKNGNLRIGPIRKGPAMAYGGAHPTPTDALFVMNELENGDRARSVQGLEPIACLCAGPGDLL